MLAGLRSVVGQVRSGRTLRLACAGECWLQSRGSQDSPCILPCRLSQAAFSLVGLVLFVFSFKINSSFILLFHFVFSVVKQWSEGVRVHFCSGKQCPRPAVQKEQIYENLHLLFFSVLTNWQDCKEEEVRTAAFPAQDGSRDLRVSSSVCAQWAESRGVMRGSGLALQRAPNCARGFISVPGSSCISQHCGRECWGRGCGENLPAVQSKLISCWARGYGEGEGKEKALSVGRADLQSLMPGLCRSSPGQGGRLWGCDCHDGCPPARGAAPRASLGAAPLACAPVSGGPRHLQSDQGEMLCRAQRGCGAHANATRGQGDAGRRWGTLGERRNR